MSMLGTLRDSTFRKLFDLENGSVTARRVDSFITWLIIANLDLYFYAGVCAEALRRSGGPSIPWQENPGIAASDHAFRADRPTGHRPLLVALARNH